MKSQAFLQGFLHVRRGQHENEAILQGFLHFRRWQYQKRSNSARLPQPQCLNLTTSKTKEFCEASFKNGKLNAELTASCQCVLRFFYSICLKYCACHEKVMPNHTKCCTCHAKSSSQTWRSDAPKCNPSQEISVVLLTFLMNMSLVLRLPREIHLCRSSSSVPRLPSFLEILQNLQVFDHFWQGGESLALATHNDASPSKSGANMWCFAHLNFELCLPPQRRTLFRHLNFQKCSKAEVFCTIWLGNVFRATAAYTFSTSQLPKSVLNVMCFVILTTSTCASRHNGVHFLNIATSKSGPNMVWFLHFDFQMCFAPQRRALFRQLNFQKCSEREVFLRFYVHFQRCFAPQGRATFHLWPDGSAPAALASLLFDPPEPQIIGSSVSRQCFATFLPFRAPTSSFFSLFLFSDLLSSALVLSDSSHLCFSIRSYCRKFGF